MDNNFELKVIWKDAKINKINDKILVEKKFEKFFYNTEKSEDLKLVFSTKNAGKRVKMDYLYAFLLIIFIIIIGNLLDDYGPTGDFASKIAVVILIGTGLAIFALIMSPFTTYKNIFFEIDKFGQERILKQNFIGSISTVLNLENVNYIKRVNDKKNIYFLVGEQDDIKISDKSIIFSVPAENKNLIIETEKMLSDFIEKEIKNFEIK